MHGCMVGHLYQFVFSVHVSVQCSLQVFMLILLLPQNSTNNITTNDMFTSTFHLQNTLTVNKINYDQL